MKTVRPGTSRGRLRSWMIFALVAIFEIGSASRAQGQAGCPAPTIPAPDPKVDLFSDKQEMDLGEAIAEQVQRDYLVIDDDDVTGYVRRIGANLIAQAPASGLKIQFFLLDQPVANAVTLPGGRIYVSRKLIGMTRNEDELASVLGHELGHALTRQPAAEMSQLFRQVLGVTDMGTRDDIYRNYELLQENVVKKRKVFEHLGADEKAEQLIADQVGMQLMTRAGYSPQAFPDFFDRLAQTKGKTGSWLTDMFGATKPDSRRLREMQKDVAGQGACKTATAMTNTPEYQKWKSAVVAYNGLGYKEQLHEVFGKTKLSPPLQSDIRNVLFSPDGKYLLAQDESTINVMTREPLATRFTIYAPDSYAASFTADSQSIIFYSTTFRVETWSVPEEARTNVVEMVIPGGCWQSALSPGGKFLACYTGNFELALYDVASGEQKFLKKGYSEPRTVTEYYVLLLTSILDNEEVEAIHMKFSPDGRYFVAHGLEDATVALDLDSFKTFSLPASVRDLMWGNFTFVGGAQIAGADLFNPKNSGVVKFPSGESVRKIQFGNSHLQTTTDGLHVLVRPIKDHAVGVADLSTGTILLGSDKPSLDAYGGVYANERADGDLAISNTKDLKEIAKVLLGVGQLGSLRAVSVSPDLRWLAISERTRGGLWDLVKGQRVFYTRGFNGAVVSKNGVVDADFGKFQNTVRQMAKMDPEHRTIDRTRDLGDEESWQQGSVMVRTIRNGKDDRKLRNIKLQVSDTASGKTLWSHDYPKEGPRVLSRRAEGNLVLYWLANSDGAKLEVKSNAALSSSGNKFEGGPNDYFLEVLEASSGKTLGAAVVKTTKGAFELNAAESSGEWLVAGDSTNRLLVYSLPTGEQKGILFGRKPVISPGSSLLAAENERGQLSLYDLQSLGLRQRYFFTSRIAFTYFASDNRRMLVLTGDQTAYFLAVPKSDGPHVQAQQTGSSR